ncbi:MAG TPA: hypothetical protein VF163_18325, partial [Micromonosporaceae bacterium]
MRAPDLQDHRREKVLHTLLWGGVGLAPLAILILLFGSSTGSLRVAVTLAVLTVVALAISVAMRPSLDLLRVDIEERVFNEVEQARLHTREDITTAARNTHRALTDKIHALTETVEGLRTHLEILQAQAAQVPPAVVPAQVAGVAVPPPSVAHPGVVRRTETVHVTRRTTTVDSGDSDSRGTVYGSRTAVDGEWRDDDRRRGHRDEDDRYGR